MKPNIAQGLLRLSLSAGLNGRGAVPVAVAISTIATPPQIADQPRRIAPRRAFADARTAGLPDGKVRLSGRLSPSRLHRRQHASGTDSPRRHAAPAHAGGHGGTGRGTRWFSGRGSASSISMQRIAAAAHRHIPRRLPTRRSAAPPSLSEP